MYPNSLCNKKPNYLKCKRLVTLGILILRPRSVSNRKPRLFFEVCTHYKDFKSKEYVTLLIFKVITTRIRFDDIRLKEISIRILKIQNANRFQYKKLGNFLLLHLLHQIAPHQLVYIQKLSMKLEFEIHLIHVCGVGQIEKKKIITYGE